MDRPVSRRRALGLAGAVTAAAAGLSAWFRHLVSPAPRPRVAAGTQRVPERYGDGRRQTGEWWMPPAAGEGPLPTVVLVHGGYWRAQYDASLEDALAADLAARGFLVWNVDYAASDRPWPTTFTDVAAAYDHVGTGRFADLVDPRRVAVAGHSAGGHLALWLASRLQLPSDAPGAVLPDRPGWGGVAARSGIAPAPRLCVAQAPVAALADGARLGLGSGAVQALLGGSPREVPERYGWADPVGLLPTGVPTVLVHGVDDEIVPMSQSEQYLRVAEREGSDCRLVRVPGAHFEHLDPRTPAIGALRSALAEMGRA